MQVGAVPGPEQPLLQDGRRVGDGGEDEEEDDRQEEPCSRLARAAPALRSSLPLWLCGFRQAALRTAYRRSWPDAICSEMSPNRKTTTESWIRRAAPIGILPWTWTFQSP